MERRQEISDMMRIAKWWSVHFAWWMLVLLASPAFSQQSKPSILFIGLRGGGISPALSNQLANTGWQVNALNDWRKPITWDQIKKYHVIVTWGLGQSNGDGSLSPVAQQNLEILRKYLDEGGGILLLPEFGQTIAEKSPQDVFFAPLGLKFHFDEYPVDEETSIAATPWQIPFAYTEEISPSPVSENVRAMWYPALQRRVGGQNHSFTFTADQNWTIVVKGSRTSSTKKGILMQDGTEPGSFKSDVPLVAIRSVGKGRIMVFGISAEYLVSRFANTTMENITWERGLRKQPSHGKQLFENGIRWLAEPAITGGTLGGASLDKKLLADPNKPVFSKPDDWSKPPQFPQGEALRGIVGARTAYSSGKATSEEWIAKAKAAGYSYLVFLEDFSKLTETNFLKLKADCTRLSTEQFAAIPGFFIDDEIGNHYFYFGTVFPYPKKEFLTESGTAFRSREFSEPNVKGQLSMTTLDYAYSSCSFKLASGHYLYGKGAAPFVDYFSNWYLAGIITRKNGVLLEDERKGFRAMAESGQGPLPVAIEMMDHPSQLDSPKWITYLHMPLKKAGETSVGRAKEIVDYFNAWHFYPDNPARMSISSGPEIENWSYYGQRDYVGHNEGDFVWQNYRWILHGKVKSAVPLTEVAVYDGSKLFRRFKPQGDRLSFEFDLDLNHNKQHNLVIEAIDEKGGVAVGSEQWDRNQRLQEFMCSDRNNQLTYGLTIRKDGNQVMTGGNQMLSTPNKRLTGGVSPSGTFYNDAILGAPAFDGVAGGSPEFHESVAINSVAQIAAPNVNEAFRLLHSGDVAIGEGRREYRFTEGIPVRNVWHTLWKTEEAKDFTVTRRSHFIQLNPENPLAVFIWDIDVKLRENLSNNGVYLGKLTPGKSNLWAVLDSDGKMLSGTWEEDVKSQKRSLRGILGDGQGYAAFLDSPLGGSAVFILDGKAEAVLQLPARSQMGFTIPKSETFQKKGDVSHTRVLLLGIPRVTDFTRNMPGSTTEVVERFRRDFGVDGGKTRYALDVKSGRVLRQKYLLEIDGGKDKGFSGIIKGDLISTLPILVSELNHNWSAYLYDRSAKQSRPIGLLENKAWATVSVNGTRDIFVGHPLVADNSNVIIQVTQSDADKWKVELHNPTDSPIETTISKNEFFDPWKGKKIVPTKITLQPGTSIYQEY